MAFRRTYLQDFALANFVYANATVTIYGVLAGVKDTTNLVTVFAAETGAATLVNPQILDSEGKWLQDVYIDEPVIMEITDITVGGHDTGIVVPNLDAADLLAAEQAAIGALGYAGIANNEAKRARKSAVDAAASAAALDDGQTALIAQSYG